MNISLAKLKAILLFFCENTDPRQLGKVKLMKLLYFLDFNHVKKHGVPVTWDSYINMEHGPVPSTIKNLVYSVDSEPEDAILGDTISIERSQESFMHRIVPVQKLRQSDLDLFNKSELNMLKVVSERFYSASKRTIEDAAHNEAPWLETRSLDPIPYTLAAHDVDSDFTEEEIAFYASIA